MLLGLSVPAAFASDVLVVDAAGGSPYVTIQAAVDAAVDGDTVLVKPGSYAAFVVAQKDLSVIGDGSPRPVVTGGSRVENTLAHQDVLLAGLELRGVKVAAVGLPGLTIEDALGALRVEDCQILGPDGVWCPGTPLGCPSPWPEGGEAVSVSQAVDVTFARCVLRGGKGLDDHLGTNNGGGHALVALGARLALYACDVLGGSGGGHSGAFHFLADGGNGGHGIVGSDLGVDPLALHLAGTPVRGGPGGWGAQCIDPSGWGGDGVHLSGVGAGGAALLRLDGALFGGVGGCGEPNGLPLVLLGSATSTLLPGVARRARVESPVREGQPTQSVFDGVPGDRVYLIGSPVPDFQILRASGGVLHLAPGSFGALAFQGVVPPGGVLTLTSPAATLPAGVDAQRFFLQAVFRDAASARWLSTPLTPVVLDGSL